MKKDVPECLFPCRGDFRAWLSVHAETSGGVWLVFGKTKAVVSLTANEALEEALCFGWIDGQIRSVDSNRYLKYFARRQAKSIWSEKNRKTVEMLREKGFMTPLGEKAVADAMKNGVWKSHRPDPITDEEIAAFVEKLSGILPAYENFMKMSPSVKRIYTAGYLASKSEEARQRGFDRIVDRLNKNLKPM